MIYCFDIDGTICSKVEKSKYEMAKPFEDIVETINNLYDEGHEIIFMSARGSVSKKDYSKLTRTQLDQWGVRYHKLLMNTKPNADIFIDDKGMNITDFVREYVNKKVDKREDMKNIFSNVKVFNPEVYEDKRGYFFESYGGETAPEVRQKFWQDNHSFSYKGVIRGLHYQWKNPMGKFIRVVKGTIIDYFVDIREGSPTYGQYDSVLLSEENKTCVWVPPGFAHGFEALEEATVLYKCTAYYRKDGESGINPLDKDINIPWKTKKKDQIISDKDLNSQTLIEYSKDPKFYNGFRKR